MGDASTLTNTRHSRHSQRKMHEVVGRASEVPVGSREVQQRHHVHRRTADAPSPGIHLLPRLQVRMRFLLTVLCIRVVVRRVGNVPLCACILFIHICIICLCTLCTC